MTTLASVSDVKRALHVTTDDNDSVTSEALKAALEAAEALVTRWLKQDYTQAGGLAPGPTGLGVKVEPSGGHLNVGTYYWRVSAVVAGVETAASNETQAEVAQNAKATLQWQAVQGAEQYKAYRSTVVGGMNTSPALIATFAPATSFVDLGEPVQPGKAQGATMQFFDVKEDGYVPVPLSGSTVVQVRLFRTPKATAYIAIPVLDYEVESNGRIIRLHPTFFDVPFEGAYSVHLPENWARVEVDYTPVATAVPAPIRDGVAITAAAIYQRSPTAASGFTEERMGDYMYMNRPMRGQGDMQETIPDLAKNLMRPYKRRTQLVP